MIGNIELSQPLAISFAGEESLSQKKMMLLALRTPMTINELYELFPVISEQNIAPLVAQLRQEGKVFVIGRRLSKLKCGISRRQCIYSSLEEHKEKDYSDSIQLLQSIFGVGNPKAPNCEARARVYSCR